MTRARFFFALAVIASLASPTVASGGGKPLPNWSTATAAPTGSTRPTNILRLDGSRMIWNDREAPEPTIREFLGIVADMSPQPVTILSYSARTPRERIRQARLLIDQIVRCKTGRCIEVTTPAA